MTGYADAGTGRVLLGGRPARGRRSAGNFDCVAAFWLPGTEQCGRRPEGEVEGGLRGRLFRRRFRYAVLRHSSIGTVAGAGESADEDGVLGGCGTCC